MCLLMWVRVLAGVGMCACWGGFVCLLGLVRVIAGVGMCAC